MQKSREVSTYLSYRSPVGLFSDDAEIPVTHTCSRCSRLRVGRRLQSTYVVKEVLRNILIMVYTVSVFATETRNESVCSFIPGQHICLQLRACQTPQRRVPTMMRIFTFGRLDNIQRRCLWARSPARGAGAAGSGTSSSAPQGGCRATHRAGASTGRAACTSLAAFHACHGQIIHTVTGVGECENVPLVDGTLRCRPSCSW